MLSLVLPLSTCTGVVEEGSSTQAEPMERYIISKDNSVSEWLWVSAFVVPFGISTVLRKKEANVKAELVNLFSVAPASLVVWAHGTTGELASGGVVALISIVCFVVVTAICLTRVSTGKNKAPAAPPL